VVTDREGAMAFAWDRKTFAGATLMADLNLSGKKAALYLEDLQAGQRFVSGAHQVDEE
jgi:hypothetical protein